MKLTGKILWALAQHDNIMAQSESLNKRNLTCTMTICKHLTDRWGAWKAETELLVAEIQDAKLTGEAVDELTALLGMLLAAWPNFCNLRKAIGEYDRGECETVKDIFEGIDDD